MTAPITISRRSALQGAGALIVSFSLARAGFAQGASETPEGKAAPHLPGSLAVDPHLDAWIRIDADGSATVFTGKAELGQGIKTALIQVAAEELDLPPARITMITADTGRTANEGYTAGSHSMQDSGTAIRNAAAQVRELLIAEAGKRLNLPAGQLKAENGAVIAPDGGRLGYGDLVGALDLHVAAAEISTLRDPKSFKILGTPMRRVDIPAKVTGGAAYVQDMRLPGMLHARVVRPPSYGATLKQVDMAAVEAMPGVARVIRDGNFLAVVARREYQAIKAMRTLAAAAEWQEDAHLPQQGDLAAFIMGMPSKDYKILDQHGEAGAAVLSLEVTYTRPYMLHGSIGPSCAVAHSEDGAVTVCTHTQGVYPDRAAIAELLRLPPDRVRLIHVQGSGCYGHNGADDAAGDAALIASKMPGTPVRLQWMREQENAWEPFGPAMVTKARAALDASGRIVDWNYAVWSNTHLTRPGPAGTLLAGQHIAEPFPVPEPKPIPLPEGGGDRNAIPIYTLPNAEVMHHFLPDMPLRVSALRSLGAYMNVFSIESFMGELAAAANVDPVAFRLNHLDDPRARDVVTLAAERFGWDGRPKSQDGRGCGFAFARYKNLAAFCAIAMEIETERETGRIRVRRAVAAVDSGQIANPDGLRNQIEGGILQSASWTQYESVSFDTARITSIDWATYPILRFHAVPDSVEVHLIDRPGLPFLGAGEAAQGPAAAALANAVADATGQRMRDLPLTAAKLKAAIGV
ncbi:MULTISPECIES: molybdopterin cofactor-binding domain-containing protein [Rhodomicrobium]|uniref:xanthine dehydrogenase family protein molybdopterin-binding subunit n=1 Tax=Rhodomicrobium TaxID=1068 RepID=UPI000B4B8C93|nr:MULTISPECIES: molybdopterin cofactor-binding domain-containing protein [Rhodomicrobium]